jgi:hypothetical protein
MQPRPGGDVKSAADGNRLGGADDGACQLRNAINVEESDMAQK